mgnify:FL=1
MKTNEKQIAENLYSEEGLRIILEERIKNGEMAKSIAAQIDGISEQYLSDIRKGRRAMPDKLADFLGFSKQVVYRRNGE